jgi:hypothetical protein
MKKAVVGFAAIFAMSRAIAPAQSGPPKEAIDITNAQIQNVLKYAPPAVDQSLRVIDMGDYQLSVAVIHRGKPQPRPAGARPANANAAAVANAGEKFGACRRADEPSGHD